MKVGTIAVSNSKGQIVIPKDIREQLGIHIGSSLQMSIAGKGLYISVVDAVITTVDSESSYLTLLKKTKGAWGAEQADKARQASKAKLELQASKVRKQAW